jgi:site-specific DNA-adenine methylase
MWSFYGRKSRVVKRYPEPAYDTIVEPFAGTACYSLLWCDREVILIDKDPIIVNLWWFLRDCPEETILELPDMEEGMDVRSLGLNEPLTHFIGFWANLGTAAPCHTVTKWGYSGDKWKRCKERVAGDLHKIRHWKILHGSYDDFPNIPATWFVDPPYVRGGKYYKHSSRDLDYDALASWCRGRNGQVIVCENSDAHWLPFQPLVTQQGQRHSNVEGIWTKGDPHGRV